MVQLSYKASNIARAEKENKLNFFSGVSELQTNPSFSNLLFLFKAGGGTEEEFDEVAKTGIPEIMMAIMEGISDAGFLGTRIDAKKMKAEMKKAMEDTAHSLNSGEQANQ